MAKNIIEKKANEKKTKMVEESSDDSDESSVVSESSSEEEEEEISNEVTTKDTPSSEKEGSSTDDDSSSVASSSDEEEEEEEEASDKEVSEEEVSGKEASEEEEEASDKEVSEKEEASEDEEDETSEKEEEEESSSNEDTTMAEAPAVVNESKTPASTKNNNKKRPASDKEQEESPKKVAKLNDGSAKTAPTTVENTVYVGQILLSATVDDIQTFFAKCGDITDIRLGTFPDGQSKGYAYIDFAEKEGKTKAKELNGTELKGRPIKVADATQSSSNKSDKFVQKTDTVFIGNLSNKSKEADIREAFKKFGTIKDVQIPSTNKKSDHRKGCIAFIRYNNKKEAANAIREMNGTELHGRSIRLNYAENKKLGRGKGLKKKH
ncbi:RNA-binding domain-containing protein [Backusella circina FSU 941]|nr:RNA-binding domain-containing protein [Backusella circina FSU 941]